VMCNENINWIVHVNKLQIDMRDICSHGTFPVLANQEIISSISGDVLIDLAMWNSAIIWNWFKGFVVRSYEQDTPFYTLRISQEGTPKTITTIQTSLQLSLQYEYKNNLKIYLQTNYPWKRSYAPLMTNIAIGKMKILSLLDWRYNEWAKWLEFYMERIK